MPLTWSPKTNGKQHSLFLACSPCQQLSTTPTSDATSSDMLFNSISHQLVHLILFLFAPCLLTHINLLIQTMERRTQRTQNCPCHSPIVSSEHIEPVSTLDIISRARTTPIFCPYQTIYHSLGISPLIMCPLQTNITVRIIRLVD